MKLYEPITPKYAPANRGEVKVMEREYNKIFRRLYPIEKAFHDKVMEGVLDYQTIYNYCLDSWILLCKSMKAKYWIVDADYFYKNFKAVK